MVDRRRGLVCTCLRMLLSCTQVSAFGRASAPLGEVALPLEQFIHVFEATKTGTVLYVRLLQGFATYGEL